MPSPSAQRDFAVEVVRRLRERGYEAVWAGGCVRDELLGLVPKDYDVATSATPDEVRETFGRRRTLSVGASFGVIIVLGTRESGQIDVATFRRDLSYSDGRRPDAVAFTGPQEDAQRRDFTINGLFYDPVDQRVLDFVGGQEDIRRRVVRAIGDPRQRFVEDKLRMLRAVRFAATFDFALDAATLAAVVEMASEISVVSGERVSAELRRMLAGPRRARAVELLYDSRLLPTLLPEWTAIDGAALLPPSALDLLAALDVDEFPVALAALLFALGVKHHVRDIARRWRLSNDEREHAEWLIEHVHALDAATTMAWPKLQRVLAHPFADNLIALAAARAAVGEVEPAVIEHCRAKLAVPTGERNPPPLLGGDDLKAHGIPPGKHYKLLLDRVRDAQLDGQIATRDEALRLVDQLRAADGE